MPVGAFPGRWNWGYDGVALFAPFEGYGGPQALQRLVDEAHRRGIAVLLDVVYNHFGPDGNYTAVFSDTYTNAEKETPWGPAMNFDSDGSQHVRRFFIENALMWLGDYHFDGLRLDATHAILDSSATHFLAELSDVVRRETGRPIYLIAETHENDHRYVEPTELGGYGFDAVWADDFHHAVRTSIQADHEGYSVVRRLPSLERVCGVAGCSRASMTRDYGARRRPPGKHPRWGSLVYCLQNHDQVGNRAFAERLSRTANEAEVRALTTLLLLLPETPMLFQGEEWGSQRPFLYFTDHAEELSDLIREGRRDEFGKFSAFSDPAVRDAIPDPQRRRRSSGTASKALMARFTFGLIETFHRSLSNVPGRNCVRAYRAEKLPMLVALLDGSAFSDFDDRTSGACSC